MKENWMISFCQKLFGKKKKSGGSEDMEENRDKFKERFINAPAPKYGVPLVEKYLTFDENLKPHEVTRSLSKSQSSFDELESDARFAYEKNRKAHSHEQDSQEKKGQEKKGLDL